MNEALGLALEGKLSETTSAFSAALKTAATGAMRDTAGWAKPQLRNDILKGFREGRRLANTWRVGVYPRTGASADPVISIGNRAGDLIEIFSTGVTVHASGGTWLAVPSPDVYQRLVKAIRRTLQGQFTSFRSSRFYWPEKAATLLGADEPRFWIEPGGRRGFIYVRTAGKGRTVIGWLVRQTVLGKRISGIELFERIKAELPFEYQSRFTEYLDAEVSGL